MALRDFLEELKAPAAAAVRGVGSGLSAGLHKYPAAAVMVIANQLLEKNPQLTMGEALELINEQQQADRRDHAGASLAGEVVGSFAPGSLAAKAMTTGAKAVANPLASRAAGVLAGTGAGAALGATTAFNENQDFENVGTGAALGAAGGALGSLAQTGMNVLSRNVAPRVISKKAAQSDAATNEAFQKVQERAAQLEFYKQQGASEATIKRAEQRLRSAETSWRSNAQHEGAATKLAGEMGNRELSDVAALDLMGNKSILGTLSGNFLSKRALAEGGRTLLPSLGGAGLGGVLAYATNNDPLMGALLGGGGVASPLIAAKTGIAHKVLGTGGLAALGPAAVPAGLEVQRQIQQRAAPASDELMDLFEKGQEPAKDELMDLFNSK